MITDVEKLTRGLPSALRSGALMLGLALLTAGCASGSSSHSASGSSNGMTSEELYNEYDSNNNDQIDQEEWDQAYRFMDTNGDAVVTQEEFDAARLSGRR